MASKQSIGEDAFRTIIPKLASQLQIDTDSLLANKLFSENLISSKKREHILASTEKKVEYLMVALQTEIEEDDSMVDKTIQVLKSLQGYEAIGCQLEEKLRQLKPREESEGNPLAHQDSTLQRLNFVLTGDCAVGKTSITRRFAEKVFEEGKTQITTSLGFYEKTKNFNKRTVTIKITDTAGSERFYAVFTNLYKMAEGAFLVFNINDVRSFDNISRWFEEVKKNMPVNGTIVLLANKCDLIKAENQDQVPDGEIESFAMQNGLKFFKTSAKTGEGIHEAFEYCVKECLDRIDQGLLRVENSTATCTLQLTSPTHDNDKTSCRKCAIL